MTPDTYLEKHLTWVFTKEELRNLIEEVRRAQTVTFDLETTGLDEHAYTGGPTNSGIAARIALMTITLDQKHQETPTTYAIPLSHPQSPFRSHWRQVTRILARTFQEANSHLIGHHVKFDARWIYATTGINIAPLIYWDTQMSCHLLDETALTGLKHNAEKQLGVARWDDFNLSTPGAAENVDLWRLGEYAALDTWMTWRLYEHHQHRMFLDDSGEQPWGSEERVEAGLGRLVHHISTPTVRSLATLEQRGILLDTEWTETLLVEQREAAKEALDWLAETYDLPREDATTASAALWFRELTEKAIAAGDLKLMGMTAKGNPQWTKHIISKQARAGSETAARILQHRDSQKQAEFLTSWLEKVTPEGLIHSTYRAATVKTGRLSSTDPNMQQVSYRLRPAFIPRPGYYMADFDYSQLELRIIAHLSQSEPMLAAYQNGEDLHSILAANIQTAKARHADTGAPEFPVGEVTGDMRQGGKAGNFGLAFGQGVVGFRNYADQVYGVEFSPQEAQTVVDSYFSTWEGVREWQEKMKRRAYAEGYVLSPVGRRRLLPNIHDGNQFYRGEAERQALNAPVQGFGSDLMQIALASILGYLPGTRPVEGVHPVATVHDSLVAEVPVDGWERAIREVKERMENLDPFLESLGVRLTVPLVAEVDVGTRWGFSDIHSD